MDLKIPFLLKKSKHFKESLTRFDLVVFTFEKILLQL
ncbi:hypothetical protein DSM00_2177 [Leeuwenhoekiella aequorea]|uniref:Uncharacterized protein n=1 Tax=Leeuwenhoekiella aequorea TaxID=283736 RepID=A0A4Q0P651_9FLAO|nr:hypothetical protein DSM00_2177 [Leeuwenhoekiella aequorea]